MHSSQNTNRQTKHNPQSTKPKQISNSNNYRELEQRTTDFSKRIIKMAKILSKDCINTKLISQIVRSSGSVGANYREANEALSKKDFLYRVRISRKEAKETDHWLQLIQTANPHFQERMRYLFEECKELRNIFSSIINKTDPKKR